MQKSIINHSKRYFSFNRIAALCGMLVCSSTFAVGFGDASLRSGLGQAFNVQVPVLGVSQDDLTASCIKANIETIDGDFIASPRMEFVYPGQAGNAGSGSPVLINFVTKEPISEPAVILSVAMTCGSTLKRTYSLLLDYVEASSPVLAAAVIDRAEPEKIIATPLEDSTQSAVPVSKSVAASISGSAKSTNKSSRTKVAGVTNKASSSVARNDSAIKASVAESNAKPSSKDELKVSNEEILRDDNLKPAAGLAEQPVDADQQRIQENNLAQERFASMMRDESALQAENAKGEQKIQKLEKEIEQLKLQIQNRNSDQSLSTPLIMMNVVAVLLVLALLLVVGKLWFSLKKMRQPQNDSWWNSPAANKQKTNKADVSHTIGNSEGSRSSGLSSSGSQPTQINKDDQHKKEHVGQPDVLAEFHSDKGGRDESLSAATGSVSRRHGHSIQIEELSDFTQEAEFWVSINDPKRAIEILESQSRDEKLTMPVTLLYLLDLYRQVADEEKYTKLSLRLKNKFNAHIPKFDEVIDSSKLRGLEDYEYVVSRCCTLWKTDEILPYLESLILDDREGGRMGFDLPVYRDILFLISICKELDRAKNISVTSA